VNISKSSDSNAWGPAIDVDGDGVAHVAWGEEDSGSFEIMYKSYNGTSWSSVRNLSNNSGKSEAPDIVVGDSGTIMVGWDDTTPPGWYKPMYAYYNGTTWSTAADIATDLPNRGEYVSLAYANSTFYASWTQQIYVGKRQIWMSSFDGSSWEDVEVASTIDGVCWHGATGGGIAVESDGTVHIAYDESTTETLWFSSR